MKFEKLANHRRRVIFEADETVHFHEQGVAMSALGLLAAKKRRDPEKRIIPARLGAKIARLDIFEEDTPKKLIPATMPLTIRNAVVLFEALEDYVADTPFSTAAMIGVNPHASSARIVEADMAGDMLSAMREEFGIVHVSSDDSRFGFR